MEAILHEKVFYLLATLFWQWGEGTGNEEIICKNHYIPSILILYCYFQWLLQAPDRLLSSSLISLVTHP